MSEDDAIEDTTELELVDDVPPSPKRRRVEASSAPAATAPLRGVAIAISGIQNPHRSKLREIALRLGAAYAGVWDERTTTHLICAFAGTPKFNEVSASGKGAIVRPEWLEECDRAGRRLPEADFAVHGARSSRRLHRHSAGTSGNAAAAPGRSARTSRPAARDSGSDRDSDTERSPSAAAGSAAAAAAPAAAAVRTPAAAAAAAAIGEPVDSGDET
eukprot:COSAG03_NODE_8303_length_815_cov_1.798883_1_plen_215_part_10